MTPEGRVKERVKKILKGFNAYVVMPATGGYGNSGTPDFLICHKGRFIGVECKAGKGEATALQLAHLAAIVSNGGISVIVNEHNVDSLEQILKDIP